MQREIDEHLSVACVDAPFHYPDVAYGATVDALLPGDMFPYRGCGCGYLRQHPDLHFLYHNGAKVVMKSLNVQKNTVKRIKIDGYCSEIFGYYVKRHYLCIRLH